MVIVLGWILKQFERMISISDEFRFFVIYVKVHQQSSVKDPTQVSLSFSFSLSLRMPHWALSFNLMLEFDNFSSWFPCNRCSCWCSQGTCWTGPCRCCSTSGIRGCLSSCDDVRFGLEKCGMPLNTYELSSEPSLSCAGSTSVRRPDRISGSCWTRSCWA